MTKKVDLEKLVAEISKKEKHIDLLICNAGVSGPKAEPESEDAKELKERLLNSESFEEWSDTFNTNVSAVYVSAQSYCILTGVTGNLALILPWSSQQFPSFRFSKLLRMGNIHPL